jgi:hypothetical protein
MYRIHPPGRGFWYRCHGHEPENKGCGNIVPLEATDEIVVVLLSTAREPWTELRKIEGHNYDAEIDDIRLKLADLPRLGLTDAEEDAERARLRAERDRLESLPKVPDRWEEIETGKTVGEHFASLDFDGQRTMVLDNVKAYAEKAPDGYVELMDDLLGFTGVAVPRVRIESRLFKLPRFFSLHSRAYEPDESGGSRTALGVVSPLGRSSPPLVPCLRCLTLAGDPL